MNSTTSDMRMTPETDIPEMSKQGGGDLVRRVAKTLALTGAGAGLAVTLATPAQANQPQGGPYAPTSTDGGQTLEGWADMVGDCPTARCDTWLSVQRLSPGFYGMGQHWEEVSGHWISRQQGWQSISFSLADGDCGTFRTVVEDYVLTDNPDGAVSVSAPVRGVEVGVEVPVDGGSDYDKQTYTSAEAQVCGHRYLPTDVTY